MSIQNFCVSRCRLRQFLSAITLMLLMVPAAIANETAPGDAQIKTYTAAGKTYFSLSLRPKVSADANARRDIVVLFDTSASQVGPYREKSLAALESLVSRLGSNDRVQLVAVDVNAVPMNDTFVEADGAQLQQAIAKLKQRVPLGSTDIAGSLQAAKESFQKSTDAQRSVIYIGDGLSKVNLFEADGIRKLTSDLVAQQIPVSSYAVGPRVDSQLLAALANQTGGNLAVAHPLVTAHAGNRDVGPVSMENAQAENLRLGQAAGKFLADAAQGVVVWPSETQLPASLEQMYPETLPPLRSDRDTVVIGTKSASANPSKVQIVATVAGKRSPMTWSVGADRQNVDYAFLAPLVERSKADRGASLPAVGTAGLLEMRRMSEQNAAGLNQLARRAAATGDLQGASALAKQAQLLDPTSVDSQNVQGGVQKIRHASQKGASGDLRMVRMAKGENAGGENLPPAAQAIDEAANAGQFLDKVDSMLEVISDQLKKQVEVGIREGRSQLGDNPEAVVQNLKILQENVRRTPDLAPETRAHLNDQLETALKEATRHLDVKQVRDLEKLAARARDQQRQRAAILLQRDQEQVKQLMDQFETLMAEEHYLDAHDIAKIVQEKVKDQETIGVSADHISRMTYLHRENQETRANRRRGFTSGLLSVEHSAIPFNDEQPIIYPDHSWWNEMSIRRKARWGSSTDLQKRGPQEKKILEALDRETPTIEFIETPLTEVMEYIKDARDINIWIDQAALEEAGISPDTQVTASLKGIRLRSALRLLLRNVQLTYMLRDEVMIITTPEKAETELVTKVYPVADLVLPIPQTGGGGGIGGGGGFGGGGGGQGGFGGGGGGGGFGGGGGGGGFGGGGGGFNVADDLKLTRSSSVSKPAVSTPKPVSAPEKKSAESSDSKLVSKANTQSAAIAIDKSVAPEAFWNGYFANQEVDQAKVRETVRQLMREKQFDQVISLIQAALRQGQPQTWMYQAMGLAMQLDNRPAEEVERALLSAVDFSEDVDSMMQVAHYLSRVGRDKRALQIYQQVAKLAPTRPEPYALALNTAERLEDEEAIRWATTGVLRQAWRSSETNIGAAAYRSALAQLEELKKSGDTEIESKYRNELDKAMIRDVVIQVTWTGDADVDLMVEEPNGAICSLRDPRTTGGGVMLGNESRSQDPSNASGVRRETYVCPQGFAGDYRVAIRRVFGKVTAGKVQVLVITNYNSKKQKQQQENLEIGEKDAYVAFKLDEGQRNEPLEVAQAKNAIVKQVAISQAVLAQQITSLSDPRVGTDPRLARRRSAAARGRSAVGFQPVIQTLQAGAQMTVTGVVSADRRYVRITPFPFFSSIGDVNTFTFSGLTTGGQGGFGGGGGGGLGGQGGGGFGGGGQGGGGFGGGGGGGF